MVNHDDDHDDAFGVGLFLTVLFVAGLVLAGCWVHALSTGPQP